VCVYGYRSIDVGRGWAVAWLRVNPVYVDKRAEEALVALR